MLQPITTIKTVLCLVFDKIGGYGRKIVATGAELGIKLIRKVLFPGLHKLLNSIDNSKEKKDLYERFKN